MPHTRSASRPGIRIAAVTAALALVVSVTSPVAEAGAPAMDAVIVQADSVAAARAAVEALGGEVSLELAIVDGVAADVPQVSLGALAATPGVRAVTPDAQMTVQGTIDENPDLEPASKPKSVYPKVVRADKLRAQGGDGRGVRVAVIDTGINETPDLAGRIIPVRSHLIGGEEPCVNLTGEPTCADSYGHGTFMAGIIAGNGSASKGKYTGVAPKADLISVKVGAGDGSADVSTVLAGIQWVVSFREQYDIGVINLSLGTDSTQSWTVSPLNYAVEKAWLEGITVVVAASNRGPDAGTISKPGDDPYVITVGATDDVMTTALGDDVLPDFSARGPAPGGVAKPDVVAPGGHIVSLRARGSAIDKKFPNYIDKTYRQGSGTSMSAAVVSGVAAAILSKKPTTTPDRLKFMLMDTARPVAVPDEDAVGQGMVDAYAAISAPPGLANQGLTPSSGLGSLDASRGNVYVTADGVLVQGVQTAQLIVWDLVNFLLPEWDELTWYLFDLLGTWRLTQWHGRVWEGHNWEGCSWGETHEDDCFYGHNWEGSTWYGAWD